MGKYPEECRVTDEQLTLERLTGNDAWREILKGTLPESPQPEDAVQTLSEWLRIPRQHVFCFYGARGTGKHTLARAYAGSLLKRGYTVWRFTDEDLTEVNILRLFLDFSGQDTLLIFDRISDIAIWKKLADGIERISPEERLRVIFLPADGQTMRCRLSDRILYCRLELPDLAARKFFFERRRENRFPGAAELTFERRAAVTEGLNYCELHSLVQMVRYYLMSRAAADERYATAEKMKNDGFAGGSGPLALTEKEFCMLRDMIRADGLEEQAGNVITRSAAAAISIQNVLPASPSGQLETESTEAETPADRDALFEAEAELDVRNELKEFLDL